VRAYSRSLFGDCRLKVVCLEGILHLRGSATEMEELRVNETPYTVPLCSRLGCVQLNVRNKEAAADCYLRTERALEGENLPMHCIFDGSKQHVLTSNGSFAKAHARQSNFTSYTRSPSLNHFDPKTIQ
jgi:hypothetical protein